MMMMMMMSAVVGELGRGGERVAYFEGKDPKNVFNAEAGATCLVENDSDGAVDAVTA